ncbi:MAG: DsrE family protein [Sphingomonas sp.]
MRGLTVILVSTEPAKARAALTIALGAAAIGQRSRVFAHERAVALLTADPQADPADAELARSGLPNLPSLLAMTAEAGVELWACQTGLAITGLTIADMAPATQAGGLIALMTTLGDDRLLTV